MTPDAPVRSAAWRESVDLLRELARLAERGRDQGPEARAIREAMEVPYGRLSEEEEALLDGLSADLWILADEDRLGPDPSPERTKALKEAITDERWTDVSALLGDCPRLVSGAAGALLRAQCWTALGEPAIAHEFNEYAARILASPSLDTKAVRTSARPAAAPNPLRHPRRAASPRWPALGSVERAKAA